MARKTTFDEATDAGQFNEIWDNSGVGIALFDEQLRYRAINECLSQMHGISPEHIGRHIEEIIGEVAIQVDPALKRVLSTGSPVLNLETAGTLPHQAASNRWVCNYFPVRNALGQVRQDGAIIVEKPGNVQSASIGRNNQQVVETLANSEALRSWKEIACYIGTCVKTVQRWEHVHGLPIRRLAASKGAVVFALKAEVDGWMRARSEHARSAIDEERMKAIFTYSPLPALVIDDNGVITEVNARFLELIRSSRKHLVGTKF